MCKPLLFFLFATGSLLLATAPFAPLFAQEQDLYRMPTGLHSRVSSMENRNGEKGKGGQTNRGAKGSAFTALKAGDSVSLLDITAAGIIQRIWVTVPDRTPAMLHALRLRCYWDGSRIPAVDVPLGDFFGAALGRPVPFESACFSNPEGRSFNCYIPMPFRKGARITITNEGSSYLELLFFDVDFVRTDKPAPDALYFHSVWSDHQDPVGQDVELLPKQKGRGRFLGVSIGVNVDSSYGSTWWGEGEIKMYLDGDSTWPTINGTGSEDYIGTGWSEGVFAHKYQGCLIADGKANQYVFYRLHIPDAIYFEKDCRVTIQQIGGGPAKEVKALQAKGVPLKPVSLSGAKGFRGLLDNPDALATADDKEWMNFYRCDRYIATTYFYLDRP